MAGSCITQVCVPTAVQQPFNSYASPEQRCMILADLHNV